MPAQCRLIQEKWKSSEKLSKTISAFVTVKLTLGIHSLTSSLQKTLVFSCSVVSSSTDPMDCSRPQAPLSIGFSRQEYWNGWPFPSPGDLPNPGMEPSPAALAGRFFTTEPLGKPTRWYSVQFSSVAQSCPTLCDPMNRSTPGLPVHHQLPESIQTHVHRVGDAIQPSHPLSSPPPPAFNLSQHQGLFI